MSDKVAWVNGWEVRPDSDGSHAIYDDHSVMAGPFETSTEAIAAAMRLPRHEVTVHRPTNSYPLEQPR